MNTIERVALAISEADTKLLRNPSDDIDLAKAAIEALCGGLEWRSGPEYSDGCSDLWFNGFCIAYVELEEGEYLAHFRLIPEALYKTEKEAQDAIMQAARNWIMGE